MNFQFVVNDYILLWNQFPYFLCLFSLISTFKSIGKSVFWSCYALWIDKCLKKFTLFVKYIFNNIHFVMKKACNPTFSDVQLFICNYKYCTRADCKSSLAHAFHVLHFKTYIWQLMTWKLCWEPFLSRLTILEAKSLYNSLRFTP